MKQLNFKASEDNKILDLGKQRSRLKKAMVFHNGTLLRYGMGNDYTIKGKRWIVFNEGVPIHKHDVYQIWR